MIPLLSPPFSFSTIFASAKSLNPAVFCYSRTQNPTDTSRNSRVQAQDKASCSLVSNLISLAAVVATLNSALPSHAILSLNSQTPPLSPTTPFSQSKKLETGLEADGKIRPCPSTNPGCISTNPKSSSFAFPWVIPDNSLDNAVQKLQEAIINTQKNAKILVIKDTPYGQYLQAEVDGGFSPDVLEFLVKGDTVAYRSVAAKVIYIYPFTTALGDSKGQEERMQKILDQLGWYAPSFNTMD
ncbi:thylakoid lumenal 17.9 kDa protein, chloroplastic [Macadamia integrifolia]|uniref:thylakoid lumenal 17.9 kDa protein, chloroplastic n=1 Tax=Macadamia integrifolia TaxID=60698 RepID=UPI001C4F6ED0|nr:thylakoid lumenal 17.9 kDa protein, chloroplastic [Macadamia integrifolia]